MEYLEVDVTYYLDDLGYYWRIPYGMKKEYNQEPSDILPQYRHNWEREGRFNKFPAMEDVSLVLGDFIQVKELVTLSEKGKYIGRIY